MIEEFLLKAQKDEEVGMALRKLFEDETVTDKNQGMMDLGKKFGYEFTFDDMKAYSKKLNEDNVELSDDALDAVAGGSKDGAKQFFDDFSKGFRAAIVSIVSSLGICFAD